MRGSRSITLTLEVPLVSHESKRRAQYRLAHPLLRSGAWEPPYTSSAASLPFETRYRRRLKAEGSRGQSAIERVHEVGVWSGCDTKFVVGKFNTVRSPQNREHRILLFCKGRQTEFFIDV